MLGSSEFSLDVSNLFSEFFGESTINFLGNSFNCSLSFLQRGLCFFELGLDGSLNLGVSCLEELFSKSNDFLGGFDLNFQCSSSLGILGGSKFLLSNCKFSECNLVTGLKNFTVSFSKLFFDSSNFSSYGGFLGSWGFSKLLF